MSLKRKKIVLIVDENRDVRSFIRAILSNGFHEYALEVLTHPSSDTALQVIEKKNGNIDLISTNIHRPGMNGYRFIQVVKQKYPHIKVLICSAHAGIQELQQFFDNNLVDGYIRKPFQAKEYLNRVKNIFNTQNVVRMNFL
jgi:CheY-like chemotaxis protein